MDPNSRRKESSSRSGLAGNAPAQQTRPQTLPPPPIREAMRPVLPPPHLDPPFAPRSPQLRPHYSDLLSRQNVYPPGQSSAANRTWPTPTPPPLLGKPSTTSTSLPPIQPRNLSNVPPASYEPTSPVEAMAHEVPGRSSVFDDSTYNPNPFRPAVSRAHPSPASSYHSPLTSSSGKQSSTAFFPTPYATRVIRDSPEGVEDDERAMTDRYILRVRQQPLAARACGFGERDRRVLDPPAVVQLCIKDFDVDSPPDLAELQYPFHIVHCSLFTAPPDPGETKSASDVTSVPDPSKLNAMCRRLMGTLVASPFVAVDPEAPKSNNENARLGCFFIFPDLSIRQTGKYRLRFTLMKVPMLNMIEGGESTVAASVDSDIFEVYVAGHFPGMSPSSTLIKELKRQGAAVSLKKGAVTRQKRSGNTSEKSGDDDASEAGDASSGTSKQKKRRN